MSTNDVGVPSPGTLSNMKERQNLDELLAIIRNWLRKQPHLPQNLDDQLLRRFISSSFLSIEKTKKLIDLNYTLRAQAPEIFADRDPFSTEMKSIFQLIDFCPLPRLTDKRYKIFIYRLNDPDPEKFSYSDVLKAFFMVADVRMSFDTEMAEGEIPIFDMSNTTLRHLTKVTLPLVKKYMVFTQEAHPIRLRQIHVLNTTPFLDKCMALVRPFMKSEVARLLHFHAPNTTTLFEHVAPDLIPKEYGGSLSVTMETIKAEWWQRVQEKRNYFLDPTRWDIDEGQRPIEQRQGATNLFGMQGSFRSLSID